MTFRFIHRHTLGQSGAVHRLKSHADEPLPEWAALKHQTWDGPSQTLTLDLSGHFAFLFGIVRDVDAHVELAIHEADVEASGHTNLPPLIEKRVFIPCLTHNLDELLEPTGALWEGGSHDG